ncbi:MAG: hypothetical protein ACR2K1_08825 [Saprospiraceae bacterium]
MTTLAIALYALGIVDSWGAIAPAHRKGAPLSALAVAMAWPLVNAIVLAAACWQMARERRA